MSIYLICLVFVLSVSFGGGATAALLTLDTAVDESRKEMADRSCGKVPGSATYQTRERMIYCCLAEYYPYQVSV